MEDCIFCKIAAGEIPATVVYEDDLVIAFDDLNPQAPVHTLVIPKAHHANIIDGVPAETLGAMVHAVEEVAHAKGLDEGFRVIANTGEVAGISSAAFSLVDHSTCTSWAASRSARTWSSAVSVAPLPARGPHLGKARPTGGRGVWDSRRVRARS